MNFVLSDLALEVVGDAAIVWLLSPKAAIGPRPAGGLSRLTSSLPGYFLQVGTGLKEVGHVIMPRLHVLAAPSCSLRRQPDRCNVVMRCRSGTTQWRSV